MVDLVGLDHHYPYGQIPKIRTIGNTAEAARWSSGLLHSLAGHNPPEKAKVEKNSVSRLVQFERAEDIRYTPSEEPEPKEHGPKKERKNHLHTIYFWGCIFEVHSVFMCHFFHWLQPKKLNVV